MNTPINFNLAKLLKEKRFDIPVRYYYLKDMRIHEGFDDSYWGNNRIVNWNADTIGIKPFHGFTSAPIISEVIMWLYETHGIWISVEMDYTYSSKRKYFFGKIKYFVEEFIQVSTTRSTNSHKESFELAIEYTLNNLI